MKREVDVIEEIVRIYGYDRIEVTGKLGSTYLARTIQPEQNKLRHRVAELLAANGYYEIYTNSLTKSSYARLTDALDAQQQVTILYQWDQSGTERKYFQKDLSRGLAMLSPEKDTKHIVVMESPLEAIKHRQGNSQAAQTLYLCTCGSLTKGIQKELLQVFAQAKEKSQSISLVGLDGRS